MADNDETTVFTIRTALEELSGQLASVNQTIADENVKRDLRIAASERTQHWNRVLVIIALIATFLALAAAGIGIGVAVNAKNQSTDICEASNDAVRKVSGFVDDLLAQNATRKQAAEATLASPTATADQKTAARRILDQIALTEERQHERLTLNAC